MTPLERDGSYVAAGAVLLGLLLSLLGWVDGRRADRQLRALAEAACRAEIPAALLRRADRLFLVTTRRPNPRAVGGACRGRCEDTELVERLAAHFPEDTDLRVFFELDAALWTATSWGLDSSGARSWPQFVGRWEHVAWAEGCRSAREGRRLLVARTVRTAAGRFFVIVVSRYRDSN